MNFNFYFIFIFITMAAPYLRAQQDLSPKDIKFQLDDRRGFIYEPNQLRHSVEGNPQLIYKINSQGFRDNEIILNKSIILALGSSHTFGHAISAADRWTDQLEERLPEFDVYNMGVAGYSIESIIVNAEDFLKKNNQKVKVIIYEIPSHLDQYSLMKEFLWLQPKPQYQVKEGKLSYISPPSYFEEEINWVRSFLSFCESCQSLATSVDKFLFQWPQAFYTHFIKAYGRYSYYKLWVELFKYSIHLGEKHEAKVVFMLRDDESFKLCKKIHDQCINVKDVASRKYHVNSKMKHVNREGNRIKMERVYERIKSIL